MVPESRFALCGTTILGRGAQGWKSAPGGAGEGNGAGEPFYIVWDSHPGQGRPEAGICSGRRRGGKWRRGAVLHCVRKPSWAGAPRSGNLLQGAPQGDPQDTRRVAGAAPGGALAAPRQSRRGPKARRSRPGGATGSPRERKSLPQPTPGPQRSPSGDQGIPKERRNK